MACGHKWFARADYPPLRCPSCKTRSWNTKRKRAPEQPVEFKPEEMKVIELYEAGEGCIRISLNTGMPLSMVFDTMKKHLGKEAIPRM